MDLRPTTSRLWDTVARFSDGVQRVSFLINQLHEPKDIKQVINEIYEHFSIAEKRLEGEIHSLSEKCLHEETKLSQMKSELESLVQSSARLHVSLRALENNLQEQKKTVQDAEEEKKQAEHKVDKAEEDLKEAEAAQWGVNVAAAVFTLIPPIGLTLWIVSLTALRAMVASASSSLDVANLSLTTAKGQLQSMATKLADKKSNMTQLKLKVHLTELQVNALRTGCDLYKSTLKDRHHELMQLRLVMGKLSKTSGRAEVLKDQADFILDVSSLCGLMTSLIESIESTNASDLFGIPIPHLLEKIRAIDVGEENQY